jgi:hypothetical protein
MRHDGSLAAASSSNNAAPPAQLCLRTCLSWHCTMTQLPQPLSGLRYSWLLGLMPAMLQKGYSFLLIDP